MTITSYFYDSVAGDRPYSASDFAKAFNVILKTGVISSDDGSLGLDIGGTAYTTIYAGKATVEGHFVEVTDTELLTVPAGDYSGMIVLRIDKTGSRIATLSIRTDQTPQQDAAIYEMPLYNCTVANGVITAVTDVRVQGGAVAKTSENVVTWTSDPNGVYLNLGRYGGVNKPITLFVTAAQPAASATEHRAWIQIDAF
jgi:hypothetical protein